MVDIARLLFESKVKIGFRCSARLELLANEGSSCGYLGRPLEAYGLRELSPEWRLVESFS